MRKPKTATHQLNTSLRLDDIPAKENVVSLRTGGNLAEIPADSIGASVLSAYTHSGHTFPTVGGFRTALILAAIICGVTALLSYVLPGQAVGRRPENAGLTGPT